MPDDERPTGRFRRPPDEDWTPEDMPLGQRTPRDPLPEERLPGEPPPAPPSRLPGSIGPGRNGLTADDLTPEDTPVHPTETGTPAEGRMPGVAGIAAEGRRPAEGWLPGEGRMSGESGMPSEGSMPGERAMPGEGGTSIEPGMPRESRMPREGNMPREDRMPGESRVPGEAGMSYESPMPDDGLGVPSPGDVSGRDAHTTESTEPDAWPTAPADARARGSAPAPGASSVGETAPAPSGTGAPLLSHDETDRWEQRMRRLAAGFVDEPRGAVEQADHVLEEIAGRFEEAVERRRRTLRRSWEASEDRGPGSDTDTEQLRLALRDYQELAGRLLHL